MERFRTEVRHTKVEPKNYIALNRKKACAKNSSKPIPIPQTIKPVIGDKRISLLARKERHENTVYNSGVKRSLEQLASIISSGDLEKIIQLAKGIQSTTQVGTQPNHLSPQTELEDRVISQTHVIPPVKIVEPSNIPGLNLDSENTHTRTTRSDAPILTEYYEKPHTTERHNNIPSVTTEPYFGRGQGLRQLLEVNNTTRSSVIQHNVSKPTNEFKERVQEQEEYYPWGRPGAGAPLTSFSGYDTSLHDKSTAADNNHTSSRVQPLQQPFVRHNMSLIRNPDTRPEEDRRRKANQYMLELQAQVKEKERLKKEEEEKQIELDRIRNEKVAKERDQLLLESKREQERLNTKKHEANKRFQILQAKIEEQHQMAIAEKKRKNKKYHHSNTPVQQTVSPLTTQPLSTIDLTQKQIKLNKSNKQTEHQINISSHKHGNIRNPPPSQLSVIQSTKQQQVNDNKSSSMPTTRHSNIDHFEVTKNCLAVSSECLEQSADLSVSCSVASINHVTSLHDLNTDVQHSDNNAQLQQIYSGEDSVNIIKQLQKLKQGLLVKQQELQSTYY